MTGIRDFFSYRGDQNLKAAGTVIEFTEEQKIELAKCCNDIEYFARNYVKIVSLGSGLSKFVPYEYQIELIKMVNENRFIISKLPRQAGKSTIFAIIIVHMLIFNDDFNILIAANKYKSALDIMKRIKTIYKALPKWLQQGVIKWNAGSIELENNSAVVAEATSPDSGRGGSYNFVLLDEFAFVTDNVAEEFFESIYPTISTSESAKLCIISTPNGMNHFYKRWTDAVTGKSNFAFKEINWFDVPGRDEEYKRKTIENVGLETWMQEYETTFLGNSNTLIPASVLKNIVYVNPISHKNSLKIFESPREKATYFITVDTGRGKGLDYSAFVVFDVSTTPYKVVATYRSDTVSSVFYPSIIDNISKMYNNAAILCELNDTGGEVARILHFDLENENLLWTKKQGRLGQVMSMGYGTDPGVFTSKTVKSVGCSSLKNLMENSLIIVNDYDIVKEFSNFIMHGGSYAATKGQHDDLVMCLVLFAWATKQESFKDFSDIDLRNLMISDKEEQILEDLVPFGIYDDGNDYGPVNF